MNLLASLLPLYVLDLVAGSQNCKCLYGQSCWPPAEDFESLASQLSQPLLQPLPVGTPCYTTDPDDDDECTEAQDNASNAAWRPDIPGAYQNINWEAYVFPNDTLSVCYLNTTLGVPCGQGSIPPIGVDARTPEDIQAAVRFGKKHNLKLVVKNTGHDFLGRSAGRGAFMIWTHNMKNIEFHDNFVPEGASEFESGEQAVTFGAGVQWREAYDAAGEKGKYVVGGISQNGTVGAAGGWLLGGGHSAFSAKFGLGVDNVLQITLVDAAGDYLVANKYRNPELWWALRGGGGGTWGVTTSVTYRTHPLVPFTSTQVQVKFGNPDAAQRGVAEFIRAHATLSDHAWGGYSFFSPASLSFNYLAANASPSDANVAVGPLLEVLREVGDGELLVELTSFDSWYDLSDQGYWVPAPGSPFESQVGHRGEISSRLLSRDTALNNADETAQILLSLGHVDINFVGGGAVSKPDPDSAALHPGWRNAIAQAYILEIWDNTHGADVIRAARDRLRQRTLTLDAISTDSAAYFNEATLHEADFKQAFWGSHYPRLKEIKKKVDPTGLFIVPRGVGSEDWDEDIVCRV